MHHNFIPSRYLFHLLSTFYRTKEFEWRYEAHHGNGPMDGVGGAVKSIMFKGMKSILSRLLIKTPNQFPEAADKLVTIDCLYLPQHDLLNEPDNTKKWGTRHPKAQTRWKIHSILQGFVRHWTLLPTTVPETRRSHHMWTYVSRQLGMITHVDIVMGDIRKSGMAALSCLFDMVPWRLFFFVKLWTRYAEVFQMIVQSLDF